MRSALRLFASCLFLLSAGCSGRFGASSPPVAPAAQYGKIKHVVFIIQENNAYTYASYDQTAPYFDIAHINQFISMITITSHF